MLDVTCQYDDGGFDKDEQGWVTNATAITQQGERVTVRRWGDRNGLDPYEHSVTARLRPTPSNSSARRCGCW
ncbi:MAG: hypothetical protein JNM69_10935 [Archangium sp.]|nr:hypothetical protein [Archangium sp.]